MTVTAEVSEWGTSTSDLSYEVTVGKGGDSAVSGTDYKAVSKFKINIKSGRRSGSNSFNLEPIGDTDWEGDETITIHASGTDGAQSTTLTLTDEDDRPYSGPQVTLSANPSKVSEADGVTTVTVTAASAAHAVSRKVTVSVGGSGTATSGTDYAAVSDFDITIAKDATSATGTFTLTPTQDKLAEGDETVAIAGQVDGSKGKLTGTTLTLTDDETALDVTLSVTPSSVTENGGAKTVTVTATASAAAAKARTVLVAVGNRQDTATPGSDYAAVTDFTITIAANATSGTGTFTLTPTGDSVVEGSETIGVAGTSLSTTVTGTTLTLTDDDSATVTVNDASAAEGNDMTFTVTLSAAVQGGLTVTPSFTDVTAVEGTDYDENTTALSFTGTANETRTFTVSTTEDTVLESDETFTVGLTVSGTSFDVANDDTGTGTIYDDDNTPSVNLSVNPTSVGEGDGATPVTVTATFSNANTYAIDTTVTVSVGAGGTLEPSLEIGLRHDGGDEEQGLGLEVGGQLRYADPALGLTVELRGWSLLAHGVDDYREWGAQGTVQVDPGADGLGLSLRLQPSWGMPESGVARIWQPEAVSMASETEASAHLDAELGYGLRGWDRSTVITPLVGFGRSSADERLWRLGVRLDAGSAFGLDLALTPGRSILLRGTIVW